MNQLDHYVTGPLTLLLRSFLNPIGRSARRVTQHPFHPTSFVHRRLDGIDGLTDRLVNDGRRRWRNLRLFDWILALTSSHPNHEDE